MEETPFRVRPGDLIRADDFNALVIRIEDLEKRLHEHVTTTPSGGGPPRIDSIEPSHPKVGDEITIRGANFDFRSGAARVTVDKRVVTFAFGSSDTLLRFRIPDLGTIPTSGTLATIVVSNQTDSVTRRIVVLPEEVAGDGEIALQYMGAEPDPITPNKPVRLRYQFVSATNVDVTFRVRVTGSPQSIIDGARLVDADGEELPDERVEVPSLGTTDFAVALRRTPSQGRSFTVTVDSAGDGFRRTDGPRTFKSGQSGAQDEHIRLDMIEAIDDQSERVDAGNTITLKPGRKAQVSLRVEFAKPGKYEWELDREAAPGWEISEGTLPSDGYVVREDEIPTEGPDEGWAQESPTIDVASPSGSAEPGTLVITLKRTDAEVGKDKMIELRQP